MQGGFCLKKSLLLFATFFILSGCNSLEEIQENSKVGTSRDTSINKEQIENNYINETEKYLKGVLGYIDEMNVILNDEEYVEVSLNSLSLIASELSMSNNEQRDSDTELLNVGEIGQYDKYKMTNEKVYEIQDMVYTIDLDINEAAMNYDEATIMKTRGNVMKLENLADEAIKQLQEDRLQ